MLSAARDVHGAFSRSAPRVSQSPFWVPIDMAAALQIIAERVGMSKAEAETLVRSLRLAAAAERI